MSNCFYHDHHRVQQIQYSLQNGSCLYFADYLFLHGISNDYGILKATCTFYFCGLLHHKIYMLWKMKVTLICIMIWKSTVIARFFQSKTVWPFSSIKTWGFLANRARDETFVVLLCCCVVISFAVCRSVTSPHRLFSAIWCFDTRWIALLRYSPVESFCAGVRIICLWLSFLCASALLRDSTLVSFRITCL